LPETVNIPPTDAFPLAENTPLVVIDIELIVELPTLIIVELAKVLTVVLPIVRAAVVKLILAPTLRATEVLVVPVIEAPPEPVNKPVTPRVLLSVTAPVTPKVLERVVAPVTASVPLVETAAAEITVLTVELPILTTVELAKVLTVVLPTVILDVVRLTLAPTFNATEVLVVPVIRAPPEAVIRPLTPRVLFKLVAPVTPRVLLSVVAPVTDSVPFVEIAVELINENTAFPTVIPDTRTVVFDTELPTLKAEVFTETFAPTLRILVTFAEAAMVKLAEPVILLSTCKVLAIVTAPFTPKVLEILAVDN